MAELTTTTFKKHTITLSINLPDNFVIQGRSASGQTATLVGGRMISIIFYSSDLNEEQTKMKMAEWVLELDKAFSEE
jgi:hypothetical protein